MPLLPALGFTLLLANDSKRARLNCIHHFLNQFDYDDMGFVKPEFPEINRERAYDDKASLSGRNFVPDIVKD